MSPFSPLLLSQMEESLFDGGDDGGGGVCMYERYAESQADLTSWLTAGSGALRRKEFI